jgi:hypothetical protein
MAGQLSHLLLFLHLIINNYLFYHSIHFGMKHALLLPMLALLLFSSPVFAQLEKGNILLGGNAGFSATSTTTSKSSSSKSSISYNLSPNLGYFVAKGLAVGAVLSYDHNNSSYANASSTVQKDIHSNNYTFSVGPGLQYYYQIQEKLAIQIQTSYTWGKTSGTDGVYIPEIFVDPNASNNQQILVLQTIKNNTTTFSVGPGLTYFLSPHVGLQGNLLYKINRVDPSDGYYNYGITKTSGLYFHVGLQIFLGK